MGPNPFDPYGGFFGQTPPPTPRNFPHPNKRPEKGLPWEAKIIEGVYYVPLAQVAELLDSNNVLPAVSKGIKARCQTLKEQNPGKDGKGGVSM